MVLHPSLRMLLTPHSNLSFYLIPDSPFNHIHNHAYSHVSFHNTCLTPLRQVEEQLRDLDRL